MYFTFKALSYFQHEKKVVKKKKKKSMGEKNNLRHSQEIPDSATTYLPTHCFCYDPLLRPGMLLIIQKIVLNWWRYYWYYKSVQLLSHVRLCDPMDCRMPGFPIHHQLPELSQTHAHWVSDAIQTSHPLL